MRSLAIALTAALLCGCVTQQDKIEYIKEIPMTADFHQAVEQAVKTNLKDPYSAVVGPARAAARYRNGVKEIVICGYVNAKNAFGGYNGQQPYVGVYSQTTQRFDIVTMGDQSPDAGLYVKGACRTAGIPI
jgi:hypothetical protein